MVLAGRPHFSTQQTLLFLSLHRVLRAMRGVHMQLPGGTHHFNVGLTNARDRNRRPVSPALDPWFEIAGRLRRYILTLHHSSVAQESRTLSPFHRCRNRSCQRLIRRNVRIRSGPVATQGSVEYYQSMLSHPPASKSSTIQRGLHLLSPDNSPASCVQITQGVE